MEVVATKTGPDDASGVVWALGACSYLISLCFDTN